MPYALLIAMQAAGVIIDAYGTYQQQGVADIGAKLEQMGIEASIEQNRLRAETESLNEMKKLRQNLGTQIAVYAARGTFTGAGSALTNLNESVGNFNSDERTRRLNLKSTENQLKNKLLISNLNESSYNSKLWQGFSQRTIQRVPSTIASLQGFSGAT